MKPFLSLLFMFSFLLSYAQDGSNSYEEPYSYITKQPVIVYGYDFINQRSIPGIVKVANPNLNFRQIGILKSDSALGEIYVIQFWRIHDEPEFIKSDTNKINSYTNNDFFCIKASDFKEPMVLKRYKTWHQNAKFHLGTLVVPMKIRPKQSGHPFDFTTDITLGSSVGYSFRMSPYQANYLSIVAVFGVTSVAVDSLSTNGYLNVPNTKMSAITPGLGVILEVSNFQIGAVLGMDILGGQTGENWIYNGKPWFSFGLGYQFIQRKQN